MSQPRNDERLAWLAVDAAPHERPRLDPIRQPPLTPEEIAAIDEWCARNLVRWHPETQAAFRRALIKEADLRLSCLGWTRLP